VSCTPSPACGRGWRSRVRCIPSPACGRGWRSRVRCIPSPACGRGWRSRVRVSCDQEEGVANSEDAVDVSIEALRPGTRRPPPLAVASSLRRRLVLFLFDRIRCVNGHMRLFASHRQAQPMSPPSRILRPERSGVRTVTTVIVRAAVNEAVSEARAETESSRGHVRRGADQRRWRSTRARARPTVSARLAVALACFPIPLRAVSLARRAEHPRSRPDPR